MNSHKKNAKWYLFAAPLFIGEGDVVRVNAETGEYVERVLKK